MLEYEHRQVECLRLHNRLLGDLLIRTSPYLYPFVIEYALIGATVSLLMWRGVGSTGGKAGNVKLPNAREFLRRFDRSRSACGAAAGAAVAALALVNVGIFFGAKEGENVKAQRRMT